MSSLLFIDSCEHYSAAQLTRKWTSGSATIVAGRFGSGLGVGATNPPTKTFGPEYATLTAGVAYKTASLANQIIVFSNAANGIVVQLQHVGDGRLQYRVNIGPTGTGGPFFSPPSAFVMATNRWYYVEMQATASSDSTSTTLTVDARVNEDPILSYTKVISLPTTGTYASAAFGSGATIDDIYVTDTEYLGDIKIAVLYPNAVGDSSGWTPNVGGSPNFLNVLEHPADDDATYVSATTVGLKDLYNLDDIGAGFAGTIKGAQALWLVRKSDAGAGGVKGVWKSGGTELDQASGLNFFLPNGFDPSYLDYLYSIEPERKSLFTAADWAVSEINALQLGIKRTA